ncbi:AfsR/SARP family transcriptional regulator [Rhizocola hellebori]|nr:AfsR/SARP family transcriptional regulator [Rhizocola hellebori]
MAPQIRFNVLGSVEIMAGDRPVTLDRPRRRAVLAYLVLNRGRSISSAELMDALWGDELPSTVQAQVYALVFAVRKALRQAGADHLVSVPGGYRLEAADDQIDLNLFEAKTKQAQDHANPRQAGQMLREALTLWRGEPLSGISAVFAEPARVQLRELRLSACEQLADLDLAVGLHREAVLDLTALVAANPLRERLVGQLMAALYRSDRPADALAVYRQCRDLLATEHGLDPGPHLRELESAILRRESAWPDIDRQARQFLR